MTTVNVVIRFEFAQFPRQIDCIPEELSIKNLAPNCADQSFNERMRNWNVGNRLDLFDLEHAQVGQPAVETKQRIVVGAQMPRKRPSGDYLVEHPANRHAAQVSALNAEAEDAAREHVHHHHDPVAA